MRREHDGATLLIFSKCAQQFKDHLGIAPIELAGDLLDAVKDTMVTAARGNRLTVIPDLLFTQYRAAADPVLVVPPKSAHSDYIDQEREALNAVQEGPGALRLIKVGYRMRFAGLARSVKAMEKITHSA